MTNTNESNYCSTIWDIKPEAVKDISEEISFDDYTRPQINNSRANKTAQDQPTRR